MALENHNLNPSMESINTSSSNFQPELPDLVIEQVLSHLPAKAAVRLRFLSKQWEGTLSSARTLDFDEGSDHDHDSNKLEERHSVFIETLKSLLLEEKEKNKDRKLQVLEKFRLRMTSFTTKENKFVTNWLRHCFARNVKEVDISTKGCGAANRGWLNPIRYYGGFNRKNLIRANSLISLKLEYVRIRDLGTEGLEPAAETCLFPCLKNIFFENVHFDIEAVSYFFLECPAVENVSLISTSYANYQITIQSSSLKSLVIKRCKAIKARVLNAVNLESVTVDSSSHLKSLIFTGCCNLKNINIKSRSMMDFHLNGCNDVNGTINCRTLDSFSFEGHLKSKFSIRAPRLDLSRIILWDNVSDGNQFLDLINFLKQFGSSKETVLNLPDFKGLIFPKEFREALSSPVLPRLKRFVYSMNNLAEANVRDNKELTNSIQWLAPSAHVRAEDPYEDWHVFLWTMM